MAPSWLSSWKGGRIVSSELLLTRKLEEVSKEKGKRSLGNCKKYRGASVESGIREGGEERT